jgi:hypothetical protein
MATRDDLLQAKQALSASLLRAGLRGGVVGMAAARRVGRAIASAGQNVHAVGVGRKVVDGKATEDLCVRVYVVQKIAESLLPPIYRVPGSVGGIPTDVIESPPAFLSGKKRRTAKPAAGGATAPPAAAVVACTASRRQRQRPVVAGISAGHFNITAGTIGYFCRSTRHGDDPADTYVLSNNHVYADVNQGHAGDDLYQPGPADGGTAADHFADLARWAPMHLGGTTPNRIDAAIGRLRPGVAHLAEVCSIGPIAGRPGHGRDVGS